MDNIYIAHLKVITRHKVAVAKHCFHCGLYWRGINHDNSKFGFTEFRSSALNFQGGKRSPIEAEKDKYGYSIAWQHHKGLNPHHWEYWLDNLGKRINNPIKMPLPYLIEMVCDWIGAGQIYEREEWNIHKPLAYYKKLRDERIFHSETEALVLYFLNLIDRDGLVPFYKEARKFLKAKNY